MVSDQEIARCVESLLRHSAPSSSAAAESSLSGVVRQAEAKLGVDLSHKAAFIRDQIDLLTQPQPRPPPPPPPPPQPMMTPPVTAAVPYHNHPYILSQHQLLQPTPQTLASSSIAATASTVADAAPSAYLQQTHPELSYGYPPPPPLPAAAVVAAYHLQQQLHQPQNMLPAATTVRPVSGASTKESAPTGTKRRGGPGGLNKVCGVSPELQVIVGEATMPRTQIVKQLWQYIRKNNLQDPNNKRNIICNDELRRVFETDCTDMFKMNKLLSKHIITLDPTKDPVQQESKKLKLTDVVSAPELDASGNPLIISDALTKFFGSEQREMLQSEALSRLWEYIKTNQLEDSGNGSILCDSKLQELFGCESLPTSGVLEMLAHHLFKIS